MPIFTLFPRFLKAHEVPIGAPLVRAEMATHLEGCTPKLAIKRPYEAIIRRFNGAEIVMEARRVIAHGAVAIVPWIDEAAMGTPADRHAAVQSTSL